MRKGEIQLDESVIAALENGNGDKTKNSKFWAEDRSEWQKEEIKNSREKVKAAQILRSHISAAEGVTETNHANEAVESETKTFKNEKAELEKHLVGLKELLDKTNTLEKRVKIASNMQIARDKMHEVDAKIANLKAVEKEGEQKQGDSVNIDDKADDWKKLIAQNKADKLVRKAEKDSAAAPAIEKAEKKEDNPKLNLNSNPLNLKNMEKENFNEDILKDVSNAEALGEYHQKKSAEETEKKKEMKEYAEEVIPNAESTADFYVKKKKQKEEEEKYDENIAEIQSDVPNADAFVKKSKIDTRSGDRKNPIDNIDTSADNAPVDTAPVDNVSDLKKIIREREKNMPKEIGDELIDKDLEKRAAEILTTGEQDAEKQGKQNKGLKKELTEEREVNAELQDRVIRAEAILTNIENAFEEKKKELTEKEVKGLGKIWKFLNKPKVKFAIGVGLIGGATIATGGGSLVGAWLHLPYGLGIAGLGGTSNLTTALLGSGFAASAYGSKLKEGFRQNMNELLDIAKSAKESAAGGTQTEKRLQASEAASRSSAEKSTDGKNEKLDVEKIVNFVKEAKENKLTAQNLLNGFGGKVENIEGARQLIESEMSIFAFSKEKRDINDAHKWLRKKLEEINEIKKQEQVSKESTEQQPTEAGVKAVNESVELAEPAKAVETGKLEKPEAKEASKDNKPEVGNVILKETPARKEGSSAENLVSLDDQKKLFEARDRFFGLSRLIGQNKEKINTKVLETIAELVNSEIEKGKYETVDPVVKLANDLVENKEKFDFFGKEANASNRDNTAKERLISEIKTHALHMENNGLLGATAEEKEKNRLAIAALLDSKEFKSQI